MKRQENVVRFYGKTQYALECIEENIIALPHVKLFNDPFDPNLKFHTDFDESSSVFLEWLNKNMTPDHIRHLIESFPGISANSNAIEQLFGNVNRAMQRLADKMFVACFCGVTSDLHPKDNLYMWAHYANGHRGIAVEYKAVITDEDAIPENGFELCEVIYSDEIPYFTCEDVYKFCLFYKQLQTKNSDPLASENLEDNVLFQKYKRSIRLKGKIWETENERRWLATGSDSLLPYVKKPLPKEAIENVYIGCRCSLSKDDIKIMSSHLLRRNPNAKIFQAKPSKGGFALEFEDA